MTTTEMTICDNCGDDLGASGWDRITEHPHNISAEGQRLCGDCASASSGDLRLRRAGELERIERLDGPDRLCTHCGEWMTKQGRPSSSGVYYCGKRDCRSAYSRARTVELAKGIPLETRPCSSCGDRLPDRPKRITDDPDGRWCWKYLCRSRRKAAKLSKMLQESSRDFYSAMGEAPIARCPVCSRHDARIGFPHPLRGDPTGPLDCAGTIDR